MAKKDKDQQRPARQRGPDLDRQGGPEGEAGPTPKMKRKQYERR